MHYDCLHSVARAHASICIKSDASAYLSERCHHLVRVSLLPPLFWYLDAKFPRPARMEPSFTGHGGSGCHVKKRSRDADGHMKDSATAGSCVVPFHASPSIWLECRGGSEV